MRRSRAFIIAAAVILLFVLAIVLTPKGRSLNANPGPIADQESAASTPEYDIASRQGDASEQRP